MNGRKRQFLVDTEGRIWRVLAHAANLHDGVASCPIFEASESITQQLEKILGDEAYAKTFANKSAESGFKFERTARPESTNGYVSIANR